LPRAEEIRRRRELAKKMGGTERVARHVAEGRTPVRDRIDQLLDDGSFREIGSLASKVDYDETGHIRGYIPSNFITGRGQSMAGRSSSDATISLFGVAQRTAPSVTRWAGASEQPGSYGCRWCVSSTVPVVVAASGRMLR